VTDNSLPEGIPNEVESPTWSDDPFYWTYFVPEEYRRAWQTFDASVKAAVYATATKAAMHLRGCGVFDD
jgi:hypothetical protein